MGKMEIGRFNVQGSCCCHDIRVFSIVVLRISMLQVVGVFIIRLRGSGIADDFMTLGFPVKCYVIDS